MHYPPPPPLLAIASAYNRVGKKNYPRWSICSISQLGWGRTIASIFEKDLSTSMWPAIWWLVLDTFFFYYKQLQGCGYIKESLRWHLMSYFPEHHFNSCNKTWLPGHSYISPGVQFIYSACVYSGTRSLFTMEGVQCVASCHPQRQPQGALAPFHLDS